MVSSSDAVLAATATAFSVASSLATSVVSASDAASVVASSLAASVVSASDAASVVASSLAASVVSASDAASVVASSLAASVVSASVFASVVASVAAFVSASVVFVVLPPHPVSNDATIAAESTTAIFLFIRIFLLAYITHKIKTESIHHEVNTL